MADIISFNFENNKVRIIKKNNDPWFVAKDVCQILELTNPTVAISRLENDEVTKFNLGGLSGEINIVNEYGLYSLILGSRKPDAKKFKKWITHDVIPSIRKHGAYMTPEVIESTLTNPDFIIQLATTLKEEQKKRMFAERQLEEVKPKVLFADSVDVSETTILIRDLSKILKQNGVDIGEKRLFEWLREHGYLIKAKGLDYNSPTQKAMNLGLFKVKETAINHSDGEIRISKTPRVTGKGQSYFVNKFLNEFNTIKV